ACELLTEKKKTFQISGCAPWIFANATGRGYYRVSYESEANRNIAAAAEASLTPEERISFLNDSWAMVSVGRQSIADFLNIVAAMKSDRTRAVVEAMLEPFTHIHDLVVSPADKPAFEAWTRQLLRPLAQEFGSTAKPGDSDEIRQLRAVVLRTLGHAGNDPEVVTQARLLTEAYMKDPDSVDPTALPDAMALAASHGDTALYEKFRGRMKNARTPDAFYTYLRNLGNFPDPDLAVRTAQLFLSPEVKGQDVYLIFGVLSNPYTQKAGWEFVKSHFTELRDKLGAELGGGFASIANVFCDEMLRDDSQKFLADQKIPGSQRELGNARERVNGCIDLRNLQQSNLGEFLKAR
ncbi:MAG TPA: ERAP1-like C-terminal domain-containing protein, partial [Terriglobia bacterium]|nr:ERAP1-like C-terminal domain-containing protein [Terriglobia bacterium]